MKEVALLGTALALALSNNSAAAADSANLCHIANAGFYVAGSNEGVLIDAVLHRDDYDGRFALPSDETQQNIADSSGPFSKAKLALVTHKHGDHFDAEASLRHLRSSPDLHYVMPPEAFALMKSAGLTDKEASRVHASLPEWSDGPQKMTINGIELEVYRIDHGPNMPQNLGYRITLDSRSFFHPGDINASAEKLDGAGLKKTPVDYMLMPFWYAVQQRELINNAWSVGTLVGMHYHAKVQPWMTDMGGPEGLRTAVKNTWPNSIRLDREMQCHELN